MSDQVQSLQARMGRLQDRVESLERDLNDTRERIQHDVQRLVEMVVEVQTVQKKSRR